MVLRSSEEGSPLQNYANEGGENRSAAMNSKGGVIIQGVSKGALQWYSECRCVAGNK
jgi:hypothetical protein